MCAGLVAQLGLIPKTVYPAIPPELNVTVKGEFDLEARS